MKIIITGGCGFIGSNLAIALKEEGFQVTCLDNLSRRGSEIILNRILEHGCEFIYGDIRNAEDLAKLKGDYHLMIECSAEPSVMVGASGSEALFMVNNNLLGSVNCFENCRIHKIPVIFLSTSRVYPYDRINRLPFKEFPQRFDFEGSDTGISQKGISAVFPLTGYRSLYGATKLASELILQEYSINYNIPAIINRFGVVAGPWQLGKVDQGVFTYWLLNHYFKRELAYIGFGGKGKQVRDLLHIDDLIDLVKKQVSLISNYRGKIFNVGGGDFSNLSLLETTEICREITGNRLIIGTDTSDRPADVIWYKTDNEEVSKEFEWEPSRTPVNILEDIFNWLKNNETIFKKS